ncbi:MAG TPA: muconolactone Delta-isomerase family protein [Roseiflexaceae bacterium]|nr:muconolactone Delta-isomerase family protein [Roseiflexaceae bacterium]
MRYLVETSLNQPPTSEILALLPLETARGLELEASGLRERLYVAADMSRVWQVFRSESEEMLHALLSSFPLHPFVTHVVTPLAADQVAAI